MDEPREQRLAAGGRTEAAKAARRRAKGEGARENAVEIGGRGRLMRAEES